ncbi:MAG: ABC transporter ATP-binding protein [Clostridiales Family XIII bacterium]|jgi:putative ABC transport system ATP-binding protein|nr:ABC transporter ATP-binding protein [Clostridiales Family XIII bacterium]
MANFIDFQDVSKIYKSGEVEIKALADASFSVMEGEFCVIVGASGAGKTTILNILGGIDRATTGRIHLGEREISALSENELTLYRRTDVGFVFQFYNLIQNLTALENVEITTEMGIDPLDPTQVLGKVGLAHRIDNFPAQLSGGEQQRVSIARALAKNPKLLLCDEPTGALDDDTGRHILQLLHDTCKESGTTVVLITHNSVIAEVADRVIHVKNGAITSTELIENPKAISEIDW